MTTYSSTLISQATNHLKDWKTIQAEIHRSEYADFFKKWYPEIMTRSVPISIPEIWALMDRAWDEMGIEKSNDLLSYYRHPVWWLNAKVEETDEASILHRLLVAELSTQFSPKKTLDRGGGYGLLARIAHESLTDVEIDVDDVIDDAATRDLTLKFPHIHYVNAPSPPYDLIWSLEVFEHLPDPFAEIKYINSLLRDGGVLITSYSFFPMIKCHLSQNLYLHSVFHHIFSLMGFKLLYSERPSITVWVFQKVYQCNTLQMQIVRTAIYLFKPLIMLFNTVRNLASRTIKRLV